jgi:hypothetical protein
MNKSYTQKQGEIRVCLEANFKGLSYPKYIFTVLSECGFSYDRNHLDRRQKWHHLIAYKHSKWTLTYEGDVKYHVFGNDVLKTIRRAYLHWYGL